MLVLSLDCNVRLLVMSFEERGASICKIIMVKIFMFLLLLLCSVIMLRLKYFSQIVILPYVSHLMHSSHRILNSRKIQSVTKLKPDINYPKSW